jgi:hypothetical protein
MQTAQRAVFDRSIIEGYRTAKTDAIAVAAQGRRLFSGTSDGSIVMYDCKMDMVGSTSKQHRYWVQAWPDRNIFTLLVQKFRVRRPKLFANRKRGSLWLDC